MVLSPSREFKPRPGSMLINWLLKQETLTGKSTRDKRRNLTFHFPLTLGPRRFILPRVDPGISGYFRCLMLGITYLTTSVNKNI
jgi:hypothetical protein